MLESRMTDHGAFWEMWAMKHGHFKGNPMVRAGIRNMLIIRGTQIY